MSRFFSRRYDALEPYTPGEQPKDQQYIKLNTNESPFPPSPAVEAAVRREAEALSAVECLSDIQRRAGQHGSGRREGYDHKTYLSSERNQNDEGTNLYHTRLRGV